jgi:hypothetical protein
MRKKHLNLPQTLEALNALEAEDFKQLWQRYFTIPVKFTKSAMLKPLWYEIQCEHRHLKLPQKVITKLNRYSKEVKQQVKRACKVKYTLSTGTDLIKVFKNQEYKVGVIGDNQFLYNQVTYNSLSAVAKVICGKKVSGNDFFGLNNKKVRYETK